MRRLFWTPQLPGRIGYFLPRRLRSKAHNEYIKGVMEQQTKDYDLNVQSDKATLQREWAGGYERMMNAATSAAQSLGFTGEMIDAMEQVFQAAAA